MSFVAATLIAACSEDIALNKGSGGPVADCRSFSGDTVEAVAWSTAGDFLAVSTSFSSEGQGRIRVFEWPEMDKVSEALTDSLAADEAPIGDDGSVFWFAWDPFTDDAVSTQLWKLEPGWTPVTISGRMRSRARVGLVWAGGSLVTMETDVGPPERSRLVRIDLDHPEADPDPLTAWTTRLWSTFWADRSGNWLVWDEYDDAGEPQDFVVLNGGQRQVVRPQGYGGRQMTLSPDRQSLIYQRTETARLTVLDLKSGQIGIELSSREFYGGEVSATGILAGFTAHGPGESNELCLLDVTSLV